MTRADLGPERHRSRAFGFARGAIAGFVAGVTLTAGMSAIAQDVDRREVIKRMLFAISDLATDTEANAKRIVALERRLDVLELRQEK